MKSAGSVQSVASVGIGDQASVAGGGGKPKEVPPRPMPEGVISSNEPVYDCIVYLIFCPAHEVSLSLPFTTNDLLFLIKPNRTSP